MKTFIQRLYLPFGFVLFGLLFTMLIQSAWAVVGPDCDPSDPLEECTVIPQFTALLVGSGILPSANDLKVDGNATAVGSVITDTLSSYSGGVITSNNEMEAPNFGTFYYRSKRCDAAMGANPYLGQSQSSGADGPCVNENYNPPGSGGESWAPGYENSKDHLVGIEVSCDQGDHLISCMGWTGLNYQWVEGYENQVVPEPIDIDQWATFAGTDIGLNNGIWTCQALYQAGWTEGVVGGGMPPEQGGSGGGGFQSFDTAGILEANVVCFSPDQTSVDPYQYFGVNDPDYEP